MGQSVLTLGVARIGGALHCDGVPLQRIADAVGTPAYVYSAATIRERYERLDRALSRVPHRIHYSLKANSSRAILRIVHALGGGADVVSGGELHRAQRAGFAAADIIFGGVGKTEAELTLALETGVLLINVESEAELHLVDHVAGRLGARAPVSFRVNPEITLEAGHDYIRTGGPGHKFGIPHGDIVRVARIAAELHNVQLLGLDMHLGSQLSQVESYREGTERLRELVHEIRAAGVDTLRYLDLGGGLAVQYDGEAPIDLDDFVAVVLPLVAETGLTLIMEPGRFIVGNAGVLLSSVLYRKRSGDTEYVVVDAGMTELLRPSHYGAFHRIESVRAPIGQLTVDVVGPVCETGDFLARDRVLPHVAPGDTLAVYDVGAYGSVMASNYNSRPRVAEVLVDDDQFAVVTERESYDDLMRLEVDTPEWRR